MVAEPEIVESTDCPVPSLIDWYGLQLIRVVTRDEVIGPAGVHVSDSTSGSSRPRTSPLGPTDGGAPRTGSPIGSPGHSVTLGSLVSSVRVAVRLLSTTMLVFGMSQQPKPNVEKLLKLALTTPPSRVMTGGPPGR